LPPLGPAAAAAAAAGHGSNPGDVIAPTKIAAEDLPPGLRHLQLVNVGMRSSKTPLPCPKLVHLQIERCRAARAFRVPELSRCGLALKECTACVVALLSVAPVLVWLVRCLSCVCI
jgi:hypothetical protein